MWGLAGIVLGIPLAAVIRLIFNHIDHLKPVGIFMGNDLHKQEDRLLEEWDEDRYRLSSWFADKKKK